MPTPLALELAEQAPMIDEGEAPKRKGRRKKATGWAA
jgi:hypothetical protein